MTPLEQLARRLSTAETYQLLCCSSRDVVTAEVARANCDEAADDAATIMADIIIREPLTESAQAARALADGVARCAVRCRDHISTLKGKGR